MVKIRDLAKACKSKNPGPCEVTLGFERKIASAAVDSARAVRHAAATFLLALDAESLERRCSPEVTAG